MSAGGKWNIERSRPKRVRRPVMISPASPVLGRSPGGIKDATVPTDRGPDPSLYLVKSDRQASS